MKKKVLKILSALLVLIMILSALSACFGDNGNEGTSGTESSGSESSSESGSASEGSSSESDNGDSSESEDSSGDEETTPIELTGDYSDLIELSDGIKNGVNPYYTDSSKTQLTIENQVMSLGYGLVGMSGNMQVNHLSTPEGKPYIQNTMDIVLNMKNGKSYYASKSLDSAIMNIFRYGYYYYENRVEGQTFINDIVIEKEFKYDLDNYGTIKDHVTSTLKSAKDNDGILFYQLKANAPDPGVYYNKDSFAAADYDYLEFQMRVSDAAQCTVYLTTDTAGRQSYDFTSVAGDDFVTYLVPLNESFSSYSGTVNEIRFDINGPKFTEIEFKSIKVYKASYNDAPETVSLQRAFHTYSDKLHHIVQVCTTETVENIASIDMVTKISADTVNAIVVKDASGLKYTLDGVDWATAQYVGFDIKDAGIFGYILPVYNGDAYTSSAHFGSGTLNVTLEGGVYTVTQTKVPTDNKLIPSAVKTGNVSDFYMGQRIYNDQNHTFDEFIKEAENERHPLTAENIIVDTTYNEAKFVSYDPLRGSYVFTLSGSDFNKSYYIHPNRQYRVKFTVTGDDKDRKTYFMTRMSNSGALECAAMLGKGDLLLPIPLEVCKNFGADGDKTIFDIDDFLYSEVYFPMIVNAGETKDYTVVHAYQNWGVFPLKQISSIEYHQPFYHLSTGVTETNCIVPFPDAGPTLPDHRAMSAPFWGSQPQHTSGGSHVFLHFTNEEGKTVLSQTTHASIGSYGPTYADVTLDFISNDNRVKASYTHLEMPQTDENRAYYEMTYTFIEDVSFTDFANQFKLYRCTDNDATGWYQRIGYIDENNNHQIAMSKHQQAGEQKFILGDNCPYFTFFDMANCSPDDGLHFGYVNISFLIYNYEIIQGGKDITSTTNFAITNYGDFIQLSLNLGEVTFKAGDTIKINSILMPWGSQLLNDGKEDIKNGDYEYTSVIGKDANGNDILYMDKNVRDVRENTLLNPLKVTADKNCEVIESAFLPKLKTTNGKKAEFTVSGGYNNSTVRIYGFDKLTVPVIEEYVRGKWVSYRVASASQKDEKGFGYFYDGYMVHYDGDGTYSYSFVIDMEDGATERKFRVSADEDFKPWPTAIDPPYGAQINAKDDPINVYVDATELHSFKDDLLAYVSNVELIEEEALFVRYFANSGAPEGFITPFDISHDAYMNLESTGQYAVIKYRLPSNISTKLKNIQIFTSTEREKPIDNSESWAYYDLKYDDQWHVVIFDLSKLISASQFKTEENGTYKTNYFRIDIFNQSGLTEDVFIDLAYVGLCDNLEDIYELNKDMDMVTLVSNTGSDVIDPKTGSVYNDTPLNVYISADKIASATTGLASLGGSSTLSEDGSYVRLDAAVGSTYEVTSTLFSTTNPLYKNLTSTGQYVVFKYRLQSDSNVKLSGLEMFTNTFSPEAAYDSGKANFDYYMLDYDGEWHVVVVDMAAVMPNYIQKNDAGEYLLQLLRFDFFSVKIPDNIYMDYAYIGIADSLEKIYEFNSDMDEVLLVTATDKETKMDPATGNPVKYNQTPLNVYVGADRFYNITSTASAHMTTVTNEGSFVRFTGLKEKNDGTKYSEAYATLFNAADAEFSDLTSTGQYIVFKYRLPSECSTTALSLQFYTSTVSTGANTQTNSFSFRNLTFDDNWHVVIIDASKFIASEYAPDENEVYKTNFLRFDFINGTDLPEGFYIDYEYVGICDDLQKAYEFNADMSEVLLVEGDDKMTVVDLTTSE